jgi:histone chaperone ASF1
MMLYGFLQADPPEPSKIPEEDIIGVTVLLLTCSYMGQEFLRVGYYVSNEYVDEPLREEPPAKVIIDRVQRNILADKPRVTKFPIVFNATPPPSNQVAENAPANNFPMVFNAPPPSQVTDAELDDGVRPMEISSAYPQLE